MRLPQPSLTFKAAFFVGGVCFAVISYAIGTWIYALELHLTNQAEPAGDPWALLARIPTEHPSTFFPWVVATTLLAVLLGFLFDREVQLRNRMAALAVTDGLTLLYNYRYFVQQLALEIKRTQRLAHRFVVLLLDIDDFKQYNDAHGHVAGDDVLRLVAQTVRSTVRETDLVARYGGEEFVVIAQGTDREQGMLLAERVRGRIETGAPVTVSVGVAAFPDDGATVDALIQAADRAMYSAKDRGKNRVYVSVTGAGC